MKMLDYEMKKTDDLLYRMIPKPVAKRLRKGEPAVNTCEVRSVDCATYCTCNSSSMISPCPYNNRGNHLKLLLFAVH